jgi:hypothetical protein
MTDLARLEQTRERLRDELLRHAKRAGDLALQRRLASESENYLDSLSAMNKAIKKFATEGEAGVDSFDAIDKRLDYLLSLEKLARKETEIHQRYLETTIALLKAKKKELGLPED